MSILHEAQTELQPFYSKRLKVVGHTKKYKSHYDLPLNQAFLKAY
jgi:hypothetical protein